MNSLRPTNRNRRLGAYAAASAAVVAAVATPILLLGGGGGQPGAAASSSGTPTAAATYVPTPEPIPTLTPNTSPAPEAEGTEGFATDAAEIRSCGPGLLPFFDVDSEDLATSTAGTALEAMEKARPGVAARLLTPFGTAAGAPQWADLEDGTSLLVSEFRPGEWTATPADMEGCSKPGKTP